MTIVLRTKVADLIGFYDTYCHFNIADFAVALIR